MRPRTGLLLGGRYELTERIAVGGMGEVWKARDRRLGRTVAAKVLRTELVGDELFLSRLRTEAHNSAGLRHPNLAELLDHGEQAGSGYLIMELVPGETLADRLEREGTLTPRALLPILVQACHGLHAVHTSGVVHRDVKPANLILTPCGEVKVTDFGISLATNQAPMTAAGMVMGTAQYLPPEQAMGRAATAAGDVYALGIVAYECLVGHRPYTGSTQVDIAFAHVNTPLPPLPGTVPTPVRAVVERMLAKDPADRPASARACALELEAALDELTAVDTPSDGSATASRSHGSVTDPGVPALPTRRSLHRDQPGRNRSDSDQQSVRARHAADAREPLPVVAVVPRTAVVTAPARSTVSPAAPGPVTSLDRGADAGRVEPPRRAGSPGRAGTAGSAPRSARTAVVTAAPPSPAVPARTGQSRAPLTGMTRRGWRLPRWAELAADRVWLATMMVVLVVLALLVGVALGSLNPADSSSAGHAPAVPDSSTTVKDDD
ncbi:serine/threonine protein kinase [Georgenia yuyongxinii]|uniref:non-specific serine/threonine protein kinase n=1 Tax=Georgenia yuyongxinii TaxID=2589797 RepID=A0A5B8BY08_9MICO|nr:serine/threonine-protein kinase [Georgenia yuyongxinii]QDC23248.1 serine/threonine protein kinase [Georgenia yuyongxinii]